MCVFAFRLFNDAILSAEGICNIVLCHMGLHFLKMNGFWGGGGVGGKKKALTLPFFIVFFFYN